MRPNPRRSKHVLDDIATVEVVESFYGTKTGTRIVVDFNTDDPCFNVYYFKGEECVAFLGKEGKVHETLNLDNGKKQWQSIAQYQTLRKSIRSELAKLAAPTYRGLRGAKLRAWEELQ